MDWSKAKKIVIVILVLLNIGLLVLNIQQNQKFRLSSEQESAIRQVLAENQIVLYDTIPTDYFPMRQISAEILPIENEQLRRRFFDDTENPTITVEFNTTILRSQEKTVTVEDNRIVYDNTAGTGAIENFRRETAQAAADSFLEEINNEGSYQLDMVTGEEDCFTFLYYEIYNGYKVFSDYQSVTVTPLGVIHYECALYSIGGFTDEKRAICSPDEALLTFLYEMQRQERTTPIFITKMEIGYSYHPAAEATEGNRIRLVPCYRISIEGNSEPFLIQAYTNDWISAGASEEPN